MSEEQKTDLLPCPFCGGKAVFQEGPQVGFTTLHGMVNVHCDECGRSDGFIYKTKTAAACSWNTRAALAPIDVTTAARALLDAGIPDKAIQMAALPLTTESDLEPSMWNTDDEIREAILAALRAIANEETE